MGSIFKITTTIFMLFGLFACKKQISASSEHYYSKSGEIYFIPEGYSFERGQRKMDADPETFSVIENLFARDKSTIFYEGCPQRMVDLETFQLRNNIPVDKNHVYFGKNSVSVSANCAEQQLQIVPNADPNNYEKIDDGKEFWAKDNAHFFYHHTIVDVDYPSFVLLSTYFAEDKNKVYAIASKSLIPLNYRFEKAELLGAHYLLLDRSKLLYYDRYQEIGLREWDVVTTKDVELLDKFTLRIDHKIIYKGKSFAASNVDPISFEVLTKNSNYSFWAKDASHVFYNEKQLPNADPATFEVLHYAIAKDANHVYIENRIAEGIDAASFKKIAETESPKYDFIDGTGQKYRYKITHKKPSLVTVP